MTQGFMIKQISRLANSIKGSALKSAPFFCLNRCKIGKSTSLSPTFAIRGEKRLFLGMNLPETLDFKGVKF